VHLPHPHPTSPLPGGPLAIVITAVRPDNTTPADTDNPAWYRADFARDEQERPEKVERYVPLWPGVSREYAQSRATLIAAAMAPGARDRYRVKVVTL
jgi:hypothetical protein